MNPSSSRVGMNTPKRVGSAASAGSITDEQFKTAFEAVEHVRINSASSKELISEFQKQCAILENTNNDWSKRNKALQALRSLMMQNAAENHEFVSQCYQLVGAALQVSVKDLRSQVCREACITLAYFCTKLGTHFWKVAELVLPTTITLVQNSAKIMASSALNANHYIAKYVHHPKILAIILQFITAKSKEIRRCTIDILTDVINTWESNILERSWPEITQAVKCAISDADPEARSLARVAFDALQSAYPQRAEFLFQELEPSKQKMLGGRSTSSSTHSINSERDNLPGSNRSFYAVQRQNDFLSKRSTSDLNYSLRKLNLGTSMGAQSRVHRNVVPNVVRSAKPPHAVTPVGKKMLPSANAQSASKIERSNSKASSQPGSRSSSPSRNRPPRSHIPSAATERKLVSNGRDVYTVPAPGSATSTTNRGINNMQFHPKDVVRALKNVDMQARNVRPNVVRYDEDRTFGVSPSSGFVSRNQAGSAQRSSESPQDFYCALRKLDTGFKRPSLEEHTNNHASLLLDSTDGMHNGQNRWYYASAEALAEDTAKQENLIREICTVLSESDNLDGNEKDVESALSALSHMIRDGAISLWNDYFNTIFMSLLQSISQSAHRYNIKLSALRTLKDLCVSQPKRLILKPELAMLNVLNAHNCEDASVVRVAEDCGATLALGLPTNICLKLLITVIDDENTAYHQLSGAIKMMSKVLEKLPDEEVEQLLPTIVPRMMKCYENSQSMVRRAAIICLVAISNSVGINVMKPVLNASTLKLVQVYKDRMSKRNE